MYNVKVLLDLNLLLITVVDEDRLNNPHYAYGSFRR
jgi:hypothetical protein